MLLQAYYVACVLVVSCVSLLFFFFFNDTATTEIYTLSLHDALPIWCPVAVDRIGRGAFGPAPSANPGFRQSAPPGDRKSTRLNSSHSQISYAVFCLKKKTNKNRAVNCAPLHDDPPAHDFLDLPITPR